MPFEKGQSGNPNGRPRGSIDRRNAYRAIIEPYSSDLLNRAISMALEGNEQMLKLLLDRILPAKPRHNPTCLMEFTDSASANAKTILSNLANGFINPEEANSLLNALVANLKIIEQSELVDRITELERKYDKSKND